MQSLSCMHYAITCNRYTKLSAEAEDACTKAYSDIDTALGKLESLTPSTPWDQPKLTAEGKGGADSCHIAIFEGACGSAGGVYKISPSWYTEHFGGAFGALGTCGKMIDNWATRSGSHSAWLGNLQAKTDILDRASFVSDFECGTRQRMARAGHASGDGGDGGGDPLAGAVGVRATIVLEDGPQCNSTFTRTFAATQVGRLL